ncbi:MAG TPA: DUF3574 domain-containing protein [Phycisphaerales bacterium]|nr:DUF3574 domain-containing protein [Phycisphaerales bacterium]
MQRRTLLAAVLAASLLGACCCPHGRCAADPSGSRTLTRTELYFGLSIPGGGHVSPSDWQTFVDESVTPGFPDGLTVIDATGQWREASGTITREPTRILILLHEPSRDVDAKIERIRNDYKQRFRQEAVMRTDDRQRVSF